MTEPCNLATKKTDELTALKSEIHLLRTIIADLPGNVFWNDVEGVILGVNNNLAKMINAGSAENLRGKLFQNIVGDKLATEIQKTHRQCIESGQEICIEEDGFDQNKQPATYLTRKTPLRDESGQIIGVLGVSFDITDRKQMEADLVIAKERAEAASHAKSEFVLNMSHDIRTPLAGIVGGAIILNQDASMPEKMREIAEMQHISCMRLLDLLNSVLDVVSADNMNDDDIHPIPFNLSTLAQNVIELMMPAATTKNLHLTLHTDPTIPNDLFSDGVKIERILLNLLGNAIKFTKAGEVTLQIKRLSANNERAQIECIVSDTGIGIAADKIDRVFDKFFLATPSYKGLYRGQGVGLYIVKKYLSLLGSDIHISSEIDKGTRLWFTLDLKIATADEIAEAAVKLAKNKQPPASVAATPVKPVVEEAGVVR